MVSTTITTTTTVCRACLLPLSAASASDPYPRRLLSDPTFHSDYTALTPDGAAFLAQRTGVQLVGIDYLSVAAYDTCGEGHRALFSKVSE